MKISGALDQLSAMPKPVLYGLFALSGTGVLWYIQMLWLFSMLLLLVHRIEKDRIWNQGAKVPVWMLALMVILTYGAAQILNTPVVTVYRFGIYGFCFFVGYFIFSHDVVIDRLSRYWIVFGAAAVCMGIYYTVHFFGENYAVEPVVNHMTASLYCWFAILAILAFMKKYGDRSDQLTKWMTKKSWGLYVFHYLPLAIAAYYLNRYASNLPSGLVYMLVGISASGGAFVLDTLISRIPIIRWCVLGIKKEKKDV